jgi:pimeloyl-ACP methyl ester carboxylesterase
MTLELTKYTTRLVEIESNIAEWNGIPAQTQKLNLMVAEWGDPNVDSAHTYLLVHGLTANKEWWHTVAERMLAQANEPIRIITFDLRGRGESDKPEGSYYHMEASIADIAGLLKALGIEGAVNFIGHSLGAHIGIYLTSHRPELVRHLALIDGGTRLPEDVIQSIGASLGRLGLVFPDFETYTAGMRSAGIFKDWTATVEGAYRYDAKEVEGGVSSKVSKAAIEAEVANMLPFYESLPDYYPAIKVPVVILRAPKPIMPQFKPFLHPDILAEVEQALGGSMRVIEVTDTNHYSIIIETTPEMIDGLLGK